MSIMNLGTYLPKQCGIATFSSDLRNSLLPEQQVEVMAVSDDSYEYRYPSEVVFCIRQNEKQDYRKAASFINSRRSTELLIIQHEYGIYGGADGEYLLELVKLLHKPFLLVTHTVLPAPSRGQKQILNYLCHRAAGIACMTRGSARLLVNLYEAPNEIVQVIAHGVPLFKRAGAASLKAKHGLVGRDIISTFGLIGPGKGLELGIRAIAEIITDFPNTSYLILGQTHPMLQKYEGEKYRQMLIELVSKLGIEDKVMFINKFLSNDELGEYLYMTDIYLSPYPNKDQAVSGTLAFALGCGRAIVSTPYAYALENLNDGRGLLTHTADPAELAALIGQILAEPQLKARLQEKALQLGQSWTWPNIGQEYTQFISRILDDKFVREENRVNYAKL